MTPAAIQAFNARKNALTRTLHAATVEFESRPGTTFACGFGDSRVEGDLHESGQAVEIQRMGWLYWPLSHALTPAILGTFIVRTHSTVAGLVGTRWQIQSQGVASLEGDAKYECLRCD